MSSDTGLTGIMAQDAMQTSQSVKAKADMDRLKGRLSQGASNEDDLKKATEKFEAIFIEKLWSQMRKTIPKDGYLHSKYEDQYRSMFDHEVALKMAREGGIGLGDMLFSQLKDNLSKASKDTSNPMPLKPLIPTDHISIPRRNVPVGNESDEDNTQQAQSGNAVATSRHVDPAVLGSSELDRRVSALASRIEQSSEGAATSSPASDSSSTRTAQNGLQHAMVANQLAGMSMKNMAGMQSTSASQGVSQVASQASPDRGLESRKAAPAGVDPYAMYLENLSQWSGINVDAEDGVDSGS